MDALARWQELVQLPEDALPLDEAALLISASANPSLDVAVQLQRLDRLAEQVRPAEASTLCDLLFRELGLEGDTETYDDPANSYLDRVLERRRGIPISLSVLLIEIGRRCGIRLEGVGMPGHFLVRDPEQPDQFIDAFDRGRRLDRSGCERILQRLTGAPAPLTADLLATTGPRAILARMLANLDRSFERRQDRDSLAWVCRLRLALPGCALGDRTQLAARYATLGSLDVAASVLEDAAGAAPDAQVEDQLRTEAISLRARLN